MSDFLKKRCKKGIGIEIEPNIVKKDDYITLNKEDKEVRFIYRKVLKVNTVLFLL